MRKATIILALFLGFVAAASIEQQFLDFQRTYNKVYNTHDEFHYRFRVFQENLNKAAILQQKNPLARFGVTKFSDLTEEEHTRMFRMSSPPKYETRAAVKTNFTAPTVDPTNYDWSKTQYVTPVKDQGQCGSCWAFSATETIESYFALAGKRQAVSLSEEQIVDCDTTCYGCGGGWPYLAYEYVKGQGGLDSDASYPYTAGGGDSGSCQFSSSNVVAQVTGYDTISGEDGIYKQASSMGPVSVCVDASTWSAYQGGVLTSCGSSVDHCVQLVGYTNYGKSGAYWIVRNSWGADWGENGFIWIATGQDLCLIGDYATVPTTN
jgi:C1A family cysteine protease